MNQDQRIGLALGVLLVGACAAFFFRNDSRPAQKSPRLEHARELDEWIAEKSTRPYTNGIETIEEADRRHASPTDLLLAQTSLHTWNPLKLFQSRNDFPTSARSRKTGDLSVESSEFANVEGSNAVESSDLPVVALEGGIDDIRQEAKNDPHSTTERIHVVQKGESLSSIAAKLLGDRGRYQEIFDANRDQLDDPNDLKLGMTLRLPDSNSRPASRQSAVRSTVDHDQSNGSVAPTENNARTPATTSMPERLANVESSTPQPAPTRTEPSSEHADEAITQSPEQPVPKRFVPARRSPLPPRQSNSPLKADTPSENAGRRLSQISLQSTSGKIAR